MSQSRAGRRERARKPTKPLHRQVRKPMPGKPPKVEIPGTVYRRRLKHVRPPEREA